jgi:hypothetical protein
MQKKVKQQTVDGEGTAYVLAGLMKAGAMKSFCFHVFFVWSAFHCKSLGETLLIFFFSF